MQINNSNIREYLERFLEGETTCAEESEMCRYLRTTESLPADLEGYRQMFAWIDEGMPELGESSSKRVRKLRIIRRVLAWGLSSAAVIALLITFVLDYHQNAEQRELEARFYGSYVENRGYKNTDISAIMPEIESTLKDVNQMEQELAHLNFDNPDFKI